MIKMVKRKTAALASIAVLMAASAGVLWVGEAAALTPPATRASENTGDGASSEPAVVTHDARQLFLDTVHQLGASRYLTLEATQSERTSAADPVANADDQAAVNDIDEETLSISMDRPGKIRFLYSGSTMAKDETIYSFETLLNDSTILVATRHGDGKHLFGHYGVIKNMKADDVLRSRKFNVAVFASEVALLTDSEADARFFQFATGWKWLGAATDLGVEVWRVQFTDAQEKPKTWEVWITQAAPHRPTRIIVTGASGMSMASVDEAGNFHNDRTYNIIVRTELCFTKCDTQTPIAASVFARPAGDFTEKDFPENSEARIGDAVSLPELQNTDGETVDLSKSGGGPIVLDFWFAACGPCKVWTPRVAALVGEFAKQGVKLYGIDGTDSAEQIEDAQANQTGKPMTTLLDSEHAYEKNFSVSEFPTVVVIGEGGKLLYREHPDAPAAMGWLKEVLRKATEKRLTPATRAGGHP